MFILQLVRQGNQAAAEKFLQKATESAKKSELIEKQFDQAFETSAQLRRSLQPIKKNY